MLSLTSVTASSNASSPVIEAKPLAPNSNQRNPSGGDCHGNLALRGMGSGRDGGTRKDGASPDSSTNSLFSDHRHHQQKSPSSSEVRPMRTFHFGERQRQWAAEAFPHSTQIASETVTLQHAFLLASLRLDN